MLSSLYTLTSFVHHMMLGSMLQTFEQHVDGDFYEDFAGS